MLFSLAGKAAPPFDKLRTGKCGTCEFILVHRLLLANVLIFLNAYPPWAFIIHYRLVSSNLRGQAGLKENKIYPKLDFFIITY